MREDINSFFTVVARQRCDEVSFPKLIINNRDQLHNLCPYVYFFTQTKPFPTGCTCTPGGTSAVSRGYVE